MLSNECIRNFMLIKVHIILFVVRILCTDCSFLTSLPRTTKTCHTGPEICVRKIALESDPKHNPREESDTSSNQNGYRSLPLDSDFLPSRRTYQEEPDLSSLFQNNWNDWGIEQIESPEPQISHTFDSVAESAFQAITATMYGKQRLDPNVARNAMTRSIYGNRPIRKTHDTGRIGVEIDGANYLFADDEGEVYNRNFRRKSSAGAIRKTVLLLAAKLSQNPWAICEEDEQSIEPNEISTSRPIAVYFNTIKQTLMASRELQLLKQTYPSLSFDNVTFLPLENNLKIPRVMQAQDKNSKSNAKKRRKNFANGDVEPSRGIVLIVQPTDYNDEFLPPGPAIGIIENFQKLVARAAAEQLPVVVVSPRFLANNPDSTSFGNGYDQAYQQSATYGGSEPPKGPTPWVMRDFYPPVYCWIGSSLSLEKRKRGVEDGVTLNAQRNSDAIKKYSSLNARIAVTQSVMNEGHPWHVFVEEGSLSRMITNDLPIYRYLASTKSSAGRPTQNILNSILSEFNV